MEGEEISILKIEHVGNYVRRYRLEFLVVVGSHPVVIRTRETDLVFSAGQLFLQLKEVLICLQVRIGFGEGEKLAEG